MSRARRNGEAPIALADVSRAARRRPDGVVAGVFALSGAAALIYQVAWQRILLGLYGVQVEAATVVVTAFMLGLGLGALTGGWLADRPRIDHLAVFVAVEVAIGGYGAVSPWLFAWVGAWTDLTGPGVFFLATFALVALPTALMGATLPLLVGRAAHRSGNVGRSLSVLYFANTMGGAFSAVAVAIVMLREFGLEGTIRIAAGINAAVAMLALSVRARVRAAHHHEGG